MADSKQAFGRKVISLIQEIPFWKPFYKMISEDIWWLTKSVQQTDDPFDRFQHASRNHVASLDFLRPSIYVHEINIKLIFLKGDNK
jgi:hypothetical protein